MSYSNNQDIYEYYFHNLYEVIKPVIGHTTLNVDDNEKKELDDYDIKESSLLFDIVGPDFRRFKADESEYCYWVEVYIVKIIKSLLQRNNIYFHENYYGDGNEQHSLTILINGQMIETYFLFDMFYEKSNWTDYDKLAAKLIERNDDVDKIDIYIFRNFIGFFDLATLFSSNLNEDQKENIEVFELKHFFDCLFGEEEYDIFLNYAKDFYDKCNMIINYKTVITPTNETIEKFKIIKSKMLRDLDYKEILASNKNIYLSEQDFQLVYDKYIGKQMFKSLLSENDFANSFIASEWAYDVYSNAMGELDLTGVVAGYLKSIEQLLFTIVQFHSDEGIPIKTKKRGYQPYSKNIEGEIDSTLWSINEFVTKKANIIINPRIRGCINKAVDTWRTLNRNGYFHKHNLYESDDKIGEIRLQTILLYFLILGGISFTNLEEELLGINNINSEKSDSFDEGIIYAKFKDWWDNVLQYDLFNDQVRVEVLMIKRNNHWTIHTYLLNKFDFKKVMGKGSKEILTFHNCSHLKDLPAMIWNVKNLDREACERLYCNMVSKYLEENLIFKEKFEAIVIGMGDISKILLPHNKSIIETLDIEKNSTKHKKTYKVKKKKRKKKK